MSIFHKKFDWSTTSQCVFVPLRHETTTNEVGQFGTAIADESRRCVRENGHKRPHICWLPDGQAQVISEWGSRHGGSGMNYRIVMYGGGGSGGTGKENT